MRAWVVVVGVLVGCGSDAPPPAAPVYVHVTITISNAGEPVVGAVVYFQDADSAAATSALTDAHGDASATLARGGSVTARTADGVYTYVGIDDDEHLRLALTPPPLAGRSVTVTGATVDYPAASARLYASCAEQRYSSDRFAGCGATVELLLVSYAFDGATPIHQIYRPAIAVTDGDAIALQAPWVPVGEATLRGLAELTQRSLVGPGGVRAALPINPIRGGVVYDPTVPGSTVITAAPSGYSTLYDWRPQAATYDFDRSSQGLSKYYYAPTFDPAAYAMTWSGPIQSGAAGAVEDASYLELSIEPPADASRAGWRWRIFTSRDGPQIPLPRLPDPSLQIGATDCVRNQRIVNLQLPEHARSIRANALPFVRADETPWAFVTGPAGWLVLQEYQPNVLTTPPHCPSPPPPPER